MATQITPTIDLGTVHGYSGDGTAHLIIGATSGRQFTEPNIANGPQERTAIHHDNCRAVPYSHKQIGDCNCGVATLISRSKERLCTVCSEAIPAARLKAKPGATHCVPCLEAKGDVPLLRRFDENSPQGTVETLFTSDANLSRQLDRQRQTVPGYRAENAEPSFYAEHYAAAVQDAEITTEPDEETEL